MSIKDAIKALGVNIVCITLSIVCVIGIMKFRSSLLILSLCLAGLIVNGFFSLAFNIAMFSRREAKLSGEHDEGDLLSKVRRFKCNGCQETMMAATCMERQINNFNKRKDVLNSLLMESFSQDDNLFMYNNLIVRAEQTIYDNIDLAVKRISILDFNEYRELRCGNGRYSLETREKKINQYKEHISYIEKLVDTNDRLLIEFDNLITEVSRINESDDSNDLSLITDTVNAMKQLHFSEDEEVDSLKAKY